MSAKAKKLYKSEGKNQQPEEPGTIEVTEEESPTEIEASSDEDVPMDYTMVAKLLRKQKRLLEKKLQECMEQEDNNNASKQAEVEKLLTKIASKEKAIQTALDQMTIPSRAATPSKSRITVSKLPLNLPKWKSSARTTKADCVRYLTKLEDAFNSEMFPAVENGTNRWVAALLTTMSESDEADWVRSTLTQQNVNWEECKRLFTARFTRVVNFLAPARELKTIKKGNRSLASHSESFTRAMKEALLLMDGKCGVDYSQAQTEPIYYLIFVESLK